MYNYSAWNITKDDLPVSGSLAEKLTFLCRLGMLAPSLHNIQPWHFYLNSHHLTVSLDRNRMLESGDPLGRETWISLGACSENISAAAGTLGLEATIGLTKIDDDQIVISFKNVATAEDDVFDAILSRVSDRSIYNRGEIPKEVLADLLAIQPQNGIQINIVADRLIIKKIAELTSRAIGLALTSPEFKRELTGVMRNNLTKSYTGMPGFTLGWGLLRSFYQPLIIKYGNSPRYQAKLEYDAINSSSAIALVFSAGDTSKYWFNAGRAYQALGLVAAKHQVHQATTAAIVEALDFHTDVEQIVGTSNRLQTIMRLGYSDAKVSHSPRYPLERSIG